MTVETTSQPVSLDVEESPVELQDDALTQENTPESEAQAEPKQSPVQKRIDQLTWQKHEAERRLNAEIEARQVAEQRAQQLAWQQQELARRMSAPRIDQYTDPQAFQRDVQAHNEAYLNQQLQQAQYAMQAQQHAQARGQFEQRLQARVAEGRSKFTDYEAVVNNPALPPLQTANPAVLASILEHENMPEITYYLGKNPAEAHRIAAMPPARAILEVGRIAASLPANMSRRTSNAPEPPSTLGGRERSSSAPSDRDSVEEWVRKRNAQLARR